MRIFNPEVQNFILLLTGEVARGSIYDIDNPDCQNNPDLYLNTPIDFTKIIQYGVNIVNPANFSGSMLLGYGYAGSDPSFPANIPLDLPACSYHIAPIAGGSRLHAHVLIHGSLYAHVHVLFRFMIWTKD
jgi:hypothetical protein